MDDRSKDLCFYRLEKARKCLKSAQILVEAEDYSGAANRSYYSIFHCIRSLLALDGVDFSKHAGVMAYFQKNYVKQEIFEREYSKILTEAFEVRSESDYDDYYIISKEEVETQISNAKFFFDGILKYIETLFPEKSFS
ncbi:MAG: HEPN domain-containing protein [Eubacterium sp.]|nr:HEPN domain-containing protein [Eubacterium sp.]